MENQLIKDLKIFKNIFDEDKVKEYPNKLEYRGINNMEGSVDHAKRIIKKNKLKLQVNASGQLASYKAFEVIADEEAAAA